jgi:hypothetical protein
MQMGYLLFLNFAVLSITSFCFLLNFEDTFKVVALQPIKAQTQHHVEQKLYLRNDITTPTATI